MSAALCDVLGLANRPAPCDCVKWSEDGVLAVAAAHSVVLLNPGDLSGPRAFASTGSACDASTLQAAGAPADATADAHHELSNLRQGAMVSQYPMLQLSRCVRSIAWSPAGCSSAAGCLLATVTNDHQVLVHGPPAKPTSKWQLATDLSQHLLLHMDQTGWQELEVEQPAAYADGSVLRLRGGAKRKRPAERKEGGEQAPVHRPAAAFDPVVGQAVEVMTAEEGLEGCWFAATVLAVASGWALVAYQELQESEEEGSGQLREWFPVPGQRQGAAPEQANASGGLIVVHGTAEGYRLRPKSAVGGLWRAGDVCDAFLGSGWWEGCRVAEVKEGGAGLAVELMGERHEVERAQTRRCLLFQEGKWEVLVAAGSVAAPEAAAPAKAGGGKRAGRRAAAADETDSSEEGEGGEAEAEQPAAKKQRGRQPAKGAASAAGEQQHDGQQRGRRARQAAGGSGLQQLAAAAAERGSASPSAAAAAAAAGASGAPARPPAGSRKAAPPSYDVLPHFDASVLPPVDLSSLKAARSSVPLAFCRRFLALRRLVPEEDLPSYPATSSHLRDVDAQLVAQTVAELLHAHGAALSALSPKLDAKWLNTDGRQRLRSCWDRTRNKLLGGFKVAEDDPPDPSSRSDSESEGEQPQQAGRGRRRRTIEEPESGGEETEDEAGGSGAPVARQHSSLGRRGGGAGAAVALDFPAHVLPEGFSWRDLPGVDPSNEASAKRTLLLAAVRRFITLRQEYEEDELPSYETSSSHLKGRDAWLVDRVTGEFASAYAQLVSGVGWTAKALQTAWTSRLRKCWDRVAGRVAQGFNLEAEQVAAEVLAVGGDAQEDEQEAQRGPRLQNRPSARQAKKAPSRPAPASAGGSVQRGAGSGGSSSGSESDGGGATLRRKKKKMKDLAAATAAQRTRAAPATSLPSPTYQLRLLGVSALCCAWSPTVAASGHHQQQQDGAASGSAPATAGYPGRCCFLAVGAKAGRVWLWRYRLPQRYRLQPAAGDDVGDRFELVGSLAGSPEAWVTSLAWELLPDGGLVLAAGGSDGSVLLYGAGPGQLAALPGSRLEERKEEQPAAKPLAAGAMRRWCVPCPPDLRGVSVLALQLSRGGDTSGARLLVAAGKAAGGLAVWRSGELGSGGDTDKALASGAASVVADGVLGTRAATGLAWLPVQQQQQPGQPLLLACSSDGAVGCQSVDWAGDGGAPALHAAHGAPQPASGRRKRRDAGHCALGLAVSPGGLFSVVARLALAPAQEVLKTMQVHERVVQGLVQLDRLAGPEAPLRAEPALEAAAQFLVHAPPGWQPCVPASGAWELAALLRLQARWQPGAAAAAGEAALVPPLAPALLQRLEQALDEVQGQQARGEKEVLARVPAPAWRSLQLAVALRHLIDPARRVRQEQQRARKQMRVVGAAAQPAHLRRPQPAVKREAESDESEESSEGGEESSSEEEEAAALEPALSPEQLAQHGAFASLVVKARAPAQQEKKPARRRPARRRQQQQHGDGAEAAVPLDPRQAAVLEGWRGCLERAEMLLLQGSVRTQLAQAPPEGGDTRELDGPPAPPGRDAGAAARSSRLLMADWVNLCAQHPLLLPELLDTAARQVPRVLPVRGAHEYHTAQGGLPDPDSLPPRETSTLFDAPVAMAGTGVAAATSASCAAADGMLLARCPASLLLCEARPHWACRACGRPYRQPGGGVGAVGGDDSAWPLPACIFCGLLLGPACIQQLLLSPPCCS